LSTICSENAASGTGVSPVQAQAIEPAATVLSPPRAAALHFHALGCAQGS